MFNPSDEARRVGEVIRQARVEQRRTQADVAATMGYHQSKLSRLERGRGVEDTRVIRAVAEVLGIPLPRLGLTARSDTKFRTPAEDMHRRTLLAASIAAAVVPMRHPRTVHTPLLQALLPGLAPAVETAGGRGTGRLRARVVEARRMYSACEYGKLEAVLPSLIGDLRQMTHGDAALKGAELLAMAYQTAASLLLKRGHVGDAWLAVGRALAEAERAQNTVVLASTVRVHAHLMIREKHTDTAATLVRHTAGVLEGSYDQRSQQELSVLGLLLLRGVTAASRGGDRAAVEEFLGEARGVARYVADDGSDPWAHFNAINVELHAVSAAVSLGDAGDALEKAWPLTRSRIAVRERRAALWIDIARAFSQQGKLEDGYRALRTAESCAASDVRRPAVCELVADMAARDRHRRVPELQRFSQELGAVT